MNKFDKLKNWNPSPLGGGGSYLMPDIDDSYISELQSKMKATKRSEKPKRIKKLSLKISDIISYMVEYDISNVELREHNADLKICFFVNQREM